MVLLRCSSHVGLKLKRLCGLLEGSSGFLVVKRLKDDSAERLQAGMMMRMMRMTVVAVWTAAGGRRAGSSHRLGQPSDCWPLGMDGGAETQAGLFIFILIFSAGAFSVFGSLSLLVWLHFQAVSAPMFACTRVPMRSSLLPWWETSSTPPEANMDICYIPCVSSRRTPELLVIQA